jgi:hypothetical protein
MSRMRDAFAEAGFTVPDRTVERGLRDEIKVLKKRAGENRRARVVYENLTNEERPTYELLAMAEQLQDEIEVLERRLLRFQNALNLADRSRCGCGRRSSRRVGSPQSYLASARSRTRVPCEPGRCVGACC